MAKVYRMKLIEHRNIINKNPEAYEVDLKDDRLVKSIINHIREDFHNVRFNQKRNYKRDCLFTIRSTRT